MRISRVALTVAVLIAPTAVGAGSADAGIATTSTGVPCTIVGGPRTDVIDGTPGRDVICGRGGHDVIYGRGGNDIIDGGGGNDDIFGNGGDDRILGGYGHDTLEGGPGSDVIRGGPEGDTLRGGTGDTLYGGAGEDGCGGGIQRSCNDDTTPPTIVSLTLSRSSVDLTAGGTTLTLTTHARDDGGLGGLGFAQLTMPYGGRWLSVNSAVAHRLSGDLYDSLWTTTFHLPWYTPAGSWRLVGEMGGHRGPGREFVRDNAVVVTNPHGDLESPVLTELMSPAAGAQLPATDPVVVIAHVTDDRSGMGDVELCYRMDGASPSYCAQAELVGGTTTDGTWRAVLPAPGMSGTGHVSVQLTDRATRPSFYWPPQCYTMCHNPLNYPIPGGAGTFTVSP